MFKYCLIMAGGEGRRLQRFTEHQPKALIDLEGDSLISRTVPQLKGKVDTIIITTGFKGEKLVQHVYELGANVIIKTLGKGWVVAIQ